MTYDPKNFADIKYTGEMPSRPGFSAGGYGHTSGNYNISGRDYSLGTALQKGARFNIEQSAIQQGTAERGNLLSMVGQFLKPAMRREKESKEAKGILKAQGATAEELEKLGLGEGKWGRSIPFIEGKGKLGTWWGNVAPKWLGGEGSLLERKSMYKTGEGYWGENSIFEETSPIQHYAGSMYGNE